MKGFFKNYLHSQFFYAAFKKLANQGFYPDYVVTHAGWGVGLFVNSVFPNSRLACYAEWWFQWNSDDHTFDSSNPNSPRVNEKSKSREQYVNSIQALELSHASYIWSPTYYQKNQYPTGIRERILVVHEGVDIDQNIGSFSPDTHKNPPDSPFVYATRGMEPMRAFEHFVPILATLLQNDQRRFAVIGGKDKAYYRKLPPNTPSLASFAKKVFSDNCINQSRILWTGLIPYKKYRKLLQSSGVYFYFTRPFVPSWSLVEAMSCGALIVATDHACVREIVTSPSGDCCALLVDHTNHSSVVQSVETLLTNPELISRLRSNAFELARTRFDSKAQLNKLLDFLDIFDSSLFRFVHWPAFFLRS